MLARFAVPALLVAAFPMSALADDFTVRLGLKNGHLREVFFGCAKGATDGFDRGKDDPAPPPGIETGYTAFAAPPTGMPMPFLYKDIRSPADKVEWRFHGQVYKTKIIEMSWDPKTLPDAYSFCVIHGGTTIDMRKTKQLQVKASATLTIRATRQGATGEKIGSGTTDSETAEDTGKTEPAATKAAGPTTTEPSRGKTRARGSL